MCAWSSYLILWWQRNRLFKWTRGEAPEQMDVVLPRSAAPEVWSRQPDARRGAARDHFNERLLMSICVAMVLLGNVVTIFSVGHTPWWWMSRTHFLCPFVSTKRISSEMRLLCCFRKDMNLLNSVPWDFMTLHYYCNIYNYTKRCELFNLFTIHTLICQYRLFCMDMHTIVSWDFGLPWARTSLICVSSTTFSHGWL